MLLPYSCFFPALALLLACSWSAPALPLILPTPVLQPLSSSALYDFFRHGESRLLWYDRVIVVVVVVVVVVDDDETLRLVTLSQKPVLQS